jgi:hypothetical protein
MTPPLRLRLLRLRLLRLRRTRRRRSRTSLFSRPRLTSTMAVPLKDEREFESRKRGGRKIEVRSSFTQPVVGCCY